MIPKDFRYHGNSDDLRLDAYLDKVSRQAATVRVERYVGNGKSGRTVEMDMTGISFVLIQRKGSVNSAVPTQPVFTWNFDTGVSYLVGGASITDGIIGFVNGGVIIGANSAVNGVGFNFILMGV